MRYKQDQVCASCGFAFPVSAPGCPRCGRQARPEHVYAFTPWWARLLATGIDLLLVSISMTVLAAVLSPILGDPKIGVLNPATYLVGLFVYFVVMEATVGRTVGKMAFGARVLAVSEKRIGWGRSTVRNVFKMLGLSGSLVTLLCILCSKRSQRLGDMAAGTMVVRDVTKRLPEVTKQAAAATVIATFGPSTGWLGKTITLENDTFVLRDHGPISASDVMQYDQQGHLVWANNETAAWVGATARATAARLPVLAIDAYPSTSESDARCLPIAVFNQTTSWSGRTITYNEGQRWFILQDHGPITAQDVLDYGAHGRLEWAREGGREWLRDFAVWERANRPETQAAGQSSSDLAGASGETSTMQESRNPEPAAIPAGERSTGIANARQETVTSGARPVSTLRRRRLVLAAVMVAVAFIVVVALRPTGQKGSGTKSGTAAVNATPRATTPSPRVTLSPEITAFVKFAALAYEHDGSAYQNAYDSSTWRGFFRQLDAATADLKTASRLAPADDGSQQWRLANRFGQCVIDSTACLRRVGAVVVSSNNVRAELKDLRAAAARARLAKSAYNAYLACTKQVQARTSAPSVSVSPASFAGYGSPDVSSNWAGYCAVGQRFTSVTATWTEPQFHRKGSGDQRVDVWVGLDGWSTRACEQTGVDYEGMSNDPWPGCWAWYEMLPKPPVTMATAQVASGSRDMAVNPGDTITATVASLGGRRFRLTLVDDTLGERFSTIKTSSAAKCDSAEIIVEAQTGHGLHLADFCPVRFTNCLVDGRPIASFHWRRIHITADDNRIIASMSAVGADGTSFTVTRR